MQGFANSNRKNSAGYEKLIVSLTTNQPTHTDINGVTITLSVDGKVTERQWTGAQLTFMVPQGKQYTISFSNVEGYKTPVQVTRTSAPDNTYSITATYQSELVEVSVSSDNGESVDGQKVTVNNKTYTVSSGKVTAKVPLGTAYTISTDSRFGFASPSAQSITANQASRQVSLVYKVNQLRVNIASNQGTDAEIDSLKAVVSYGSTSIEVGDGETIKIPSATNVTITYPEVDGYKCPSSETINVVSGLTTKSVTYQTEVVNVTVTADYGSVEGQIITISGVSHTLDATGTVSQKVAMGTSYTISLNDKEDCDTPSSITRTAQSASYSTTMQYRVNVETVTVNVSADQGTPEGFEITISKIETVGVATKYTRLEYIESTGTQYIDTGFNPNQNTKMYIDVAFLSSVGTNVAGVRNSASDTTNRFGIISFGSSSKIGAFFRDSSIQSIAYDTLRHEYELSKSGLVVDGTSFGSANSGTFSCAYPITLGAWNNGGGGISYNNSKIYGCKIYDNDILVRNYIPALRSDGIAGLYDAVNDTFYTSSSTSNFVAGGDSSEVIATQTSVTGTYKIPFGVAYTVNASDVSSYITPALYEKTADTPTNVVSMRYVYKTDPGITNPTNGVWIQSVDGKYYSENDWDGSKTPNGVAVVSSNCEFVMALEDAHSYTCQWGGYGSEVSGITTTTDVSIAKTDYDGEAQTTTILDVLGNNSSNAPAAYYCRAYTFPNGKKGYMGAGGEWQAVFDNKTAIDSALTKCGGISMEGYYWTSTQYNSDRSWYMTFNYSYLTYFEKGGGQFDNAYVRAFATI